MRYADLTPAQRTLVDKQVAGLMAAHDMTRAQARKQVLAKIKVRTQGGRIGTGH